LKKNNFEKKTKKEKVSKKNKDKRITVVIHND
jgi:hypothetical protein